MARRTDQRHAAGTKDHDKHDHGRHDHDRHDRGSSDDARLGWKDTNRGSKDDDVLLGDDGDNRLIGFDDEDDIQGGAGDDTLKGGRGDDTLDGGAGNDILKGGLGDDTLIFDLSENSESQSVYNGGNGTDTVRVKLTADQFAALREELAALNNWMLESAESRNSGGDSFETSFGLTLRNIENMEVYVEGFGLVDPANTPPSVLGEEIRIDEDGVATVNVLANDSDPDGNSLNVAQVGDALDVDGNIVGSVTVVNNQIVFTPNSDWSGTATIEYVVDDGNGAGPDGFGIDAQRATLSVTVDAVADAPDLSVTDATGLEDTPIALDIDAGLRDTDGSEALEILISGVPDGAALSAGTRNTDGTWSLTKANLIDLTLTPAGDDHSNFTLTITTTSTEASNGDSATSVETIDVIVAPVNDPLVLNAIDQVTVDEDSPVVIEGLSISDADSLSDPDGQYSVTLSVNNGLISVAGAAAMASVVISGTFTEVNALMADVTYTGSPDFNGDDTLIITAADQGGQSEVIIPITVAPVNDAPMAYADAGEQMNDAAQLYDVLANDTDVDAADTTDTFRLVSVSAGAGEVQIVDDRVQFDPASQFDHLSFGETEEVIVVYTMEDANGAQSSSTLTVMVTGTESAASFVAGDDVALTVLEDSGESALGISAPVATDGVALEITITGLPDDVTGAVFKSDGSQVLAGDMLTSDELSSLVYRIAADAFGLAGEFSYTVSDGVTTVARVVTFDVTPVNDAPFITMPEFAPGFGDEFQVNSTTFSGQQQSSVATLADGSFVVVWTSNSEGANSWDIYGQLFDVAGGAVGGEFRINAFANHKQVDPSVAATPNGGFVVTWSSYQQDGSTWGVIGQRFDASGDRVDVAFQANTATLNAQQLSTVTTLEGGGYVVTWTSSTQDGSATGVYGQQYDMSGAVVGSEFRINTYVPNYQDSSSVAALKDGGFIVVWGSYGQDGSAYGVFGQRFDADGNVVGGEFRANNYNTLSQEAPEVAGMPDGGFIITWASEGQDGDGFGIFARRYDASGTALGGEFQVNTYTASNQSKPSVTALTDGSYVVIWQSEGQDGDATGIYGQHYDAAGNAIDGEFQVNTFTSSLQRDPHVSALQDGGFVVTWDSFDQDGSGVGVYSRIYHGSGFNALEEVPIAVDGISVGDIDAGTGLITVTLAVANGSVNLAGDVVGGVASADIAGNGTGNVVITGTIDAINATLAATNGLVYRGARDFTGTETLTVTVDDGGNTGSGGSLSDTQFVEFFVSGVMDVKGTIGDDLLTGGVGGEQITGFAGNDVLIGGAGDDMFIYGTGDGADVINDFGTGADVLDLSDVAGLLTFSDVMSTAVQNGGDTLIDFGGGDQITLIGVDKSLLLAGDFLL